MEMADRRYTVSRALLEAMREAGVTYLFANLGSDHTGIVEAYAQARGDGATDALPELVLCPHEFVALSAAQGYAQVSGEAQAVLVHVDCGTQNLGGAVHNVSRGRVPVLILAGLRPQRVHPLAPGHGRPGRDRPRLRQVRARDPHRAQRAAARPPRPADRAERAGRPGLPARGPRGHGRDGAGAARRAGRARPAAVVVAGGPDGAGAAGD
jgi:hypothetical protein